jgi:flagellar biosynthesis/type III secretory pathway chaperone
MTDLIKQLQYLSRVTKDYDQEHMTSADYEMIPAVTKLAADRIEELVKELNISRMANVVMDNGAAELEAKLAKAMEYLRKIAAYTHIGTHEQGIVQNAEARIALAALAELEGKE